ncbi:hypothetical protein ACHQM5_030808 [Ranunculus cassubicifolius]
MATYGSASKGCKDVLPHSNLKEEMKLSQEVSDTCYEGGDDIVSRGFRDLDISSKFDDTTWEDMLSQCDICYNTHHPSFCPYTERYPRDAPYNKARCEIMCLCGNRFNEDKWMCSSCGSNDKSVLITKKCVICRGFDHGSYECPKDKDRAAMFKEFRDEERSRVPTPYIIVGEYVPL